MKKIFVTLMIVASALSLAVSEAHAKRLGSGGSFGRQSQSIKRYEAPAQPSRQMAAPAPNTPAPNIPPKPASPWKNILGGALLGLGLGALLSHLGIGGALANLIGGIAMVALLGLVIALIYRVVRGNRSPLSYSSSPSYSSSSSPYAHSTPAAASAQPIYAPEIGSHLPAADAQSPANHIPWGIPADFDVAGFLRHSKTYFIRLQAAWDKAEVNDLREFTTPEMFAELKLQLQERGASANYTDVVSIDAELIGIETMQGEYLASVKFSGTMREAQDAPAEPFREVWNLSKPISGQSGWMLAGIQQLH